MTWRKIPGNPFWHFNDSPSPSKRQSLWANMSFESGVRTDGVNQVFVQVRRSYDSDDADRGEISATYWNAQVGVYGVQPSSYYASLPAVDGWTPASLGSSLVLWLDADDASTITLNGSNVVQWDDKSGNNRNHTQGTESSQPLLIADGINGKPALKFPDAEERNLNISDSDPTFGTTDLFADENDFHTLFCVMNGGDGGGKVQSSGGRIGVGYSKAGGIGGAGTFVIGLLTHNGSNVPLTPPRWIVQQRGWGGTSSNGAVNVPTYHPGALNTPAMVGMVWNGTTTTATVDGTLFSNIGLPHTASNQNSPGRIGASGNNTVSSGGGNSLTGEIIICDTALPEADRKKLEGYLAWKWDLEANLPADHPYKSAPPVV